MNSPQYRFLLCCGLAVGGGAIVFLSLSLCCCCCFVTTVVIGSRCRCQWRVASMMVPGSPTMKLRCLLCLSGPADAFWRPDNSIVIVVARRTAFSPIHVARFYPPPWETLQMVKCIHRYAVDSDVVFGRWVVFRFVNYVNRQKTDYG